MIDKYESLFDGIGASIRLLRASGNPHCQSTLDRIESSLMNLHHGLLSKDYEIARLQEEVKYEQERNRNNVMMLSEQVTAKDKEIAKLKEKIKSMTKVVFCGDCIKAFHTKITMALKCRTWGCQVNPNGFCSRGIRKKQKGI